MADDEELGKVAQEAVDMKVLAKEWAKNKKYQGQDDEGGGGRGSKKQDIYMEM